MMRQLEIDFGSDSPQLAPATILRASFERVRRRYFRGRFPGGTEMGFGLLRASSFRTIGRADIDDRRIVVHPELLRAPWYELLDLVMYHEMLHFAEYHHNARFKSRERRFARYAELSRFEARFFRFLEEKREGGRGLEHRPVAARSKNDGAVRRVALKPERRTSPGSPHSGASP